ncbi:hypothetical protein [Acidisphaera sp. L21]|uniref:hypothetical protein n=1 Tax=Acidisphaera sp. L21 TaxID=1641851 RepID=UPI00131A66C1|nr:hypothetical protein [Acidisphaera sp. L21]
MTKALTKVISTLRPSSRMQNLRAKTRGVYPSQRDWDRLLQSIDEKSAASEALVNGVLEDQARRRA